jgi:hypothetical protein
MSQCPAGAPCGAADCRGSGPLKTAERVVEYAAPQISDRAVPRAAICPSSRWPTSSSATARSGAGWLKRVLADGKKVLVHPAPSPTLKRSDLCST